MFNNKMPPRLLQIHFKRWLHDRKLPTVKNKTKLPVLTEKIGVKSEIKEDKIKIKEDKIKISKSNVKTTKD